MISDSSLVVTDGIKVENEESIISSDEIDEVIGEALASQTGKEKRPQKEKTTNSLMSNACHSLKKALDSEEEPDPKLIAQLKKYVLELDEKVNKRLAI